MFDLEKFVKNQSGEDREGLENLVQSFAKNIQEKSDLAQKLEIAERQNRLLRKKLFGASSEKSKPAEPLIEGELPLFNEFELTAQECDKNKVVEEDDLTTNSEIPSAPLATGQSDKKRGRRKLSKDFPRVVVEHDLSEADKQCACGTAMTCIGVTTSEEVDYIPAQIRVIEHHCKKYLCEACAKAQKTDPAITVPSSTAKKPAALIEKSIASAGLLAHIAVSKFCDYLPLYRQEQIFRRLGLDLSRQTMSVWMLKVGEAIIPLVNLMQEEILNYDVAYADETTVQVLNEPGRRPQTKSYIWCFIGGAPEKAVAIYQYHPTRGGEVVSQFLESYRGGLHCDGYAAYHALIKSGQVTGLNCWAHVRRKFMEALPNGEEKGVAGYVVQQIRKLYYLEDLIKQRDLDEQAIRTVRQKMARPILETLKTYLDEKSRTSLPQGALGKAIAYTRQRWSYLLNYLEDGRYEIDNNRTERAIKPFVMGRNNWLFSHSVDGAHTSARLYSLIETAKMHLLNPVAYLKYLFAELPNCKTVQDYEALLPYNVQDPDLKISI
jgi:transposase